MSYTNINRLSKAFKCSITGLYVVHEESVLHPINWLIWDLLGYSGKPFQISWITQLAQDETQDSVREAGNGMEAGLWTHTDFALPMSWNLPSQSFQQPQFQPWPLPLHFISEKLRHSFHRSGLWAWRNLPAATHPFWLVTLSSASPLLHTKCDFKFPHYPVFPLPDHTQIWICMFMWQH